MTRFVADFRLTRSLAAVASCAALACVLGARLALADELPDRAAFMSQHMPYAAFDRSPQQHVKVQNADLAVAFVPGDLQLSHERILQWIKQRAGFVAAYYGRFPVDTARILIVPVEGTGVKFGQTFGYRGAATRVMIGEGTTEAELNDDWVLVHEMVHFAFPMTDDAQIWFREGQATYIESISRVQASDRNEAEVWRELSLQMPKGLPKEGDEGLDHTHTWGRTYWGGAVFCLLADVEIRKRTNNKFGLQDALRAVVNAGGVNTETWPVEKAIAIGDKATGTTAIHDLYEALKADPGHIELTDLFRKLGIRIDGEKVILDDSAELAGARKAIMSKSNH